ncbi:transmembrane protein 192-like [Contarinia nasturtii]|uniref:transmembrane protein 192-like n=1 Tax=Contarinia nasturtii TaxID=265458 RepID=UPI0012D41959|nr:transmembrane protein 192-like [Contarinia nasturtii]
MTTYGSDRALNNHGNPELSSDNSTEKKQSYSLNLHTSHLAALHLLLSLSVFITSVYLELQWLTEQNCRTYYIMIYIRCIFWIASCVLDALFTRRHNELRRHGYHDFYRDKILSYKNAPLFIVTIWNMVLFLVQTIMFENYGSEFLLQCQRIAQSPITYVCIFCGLETILLMIVHGTYIMRVYKFNSTHSLPDALRDIEQPFLGSLGITIDNSKIGDLLEKQADLIYYLKEQNFNLKRKLLQLNQRTDVCGSYQKI